MEATYDKNNTNSAFGNDTSHFKFSNMDDGLNMSSDMPESNEQEQEEHQMIPSPTITKNNYNETNNVHINDKSTNVVDHHQQFVDDFGPETDVDAMDDSNATKYPVDVQTHDSINEYNLSNGAKPFSLETKIIQQLSEQNREFLSDSNPFKNDHFDQFSDDHVMLDQTIAKIPSSSGMVDNKIIDALESLEVSNGDQEKYELESEKQMDDLLDTRQKSPEMPDFTEKVDYNHEKSLFTLDAASEVGNTCPQHIDNTFNQTVEQDPSVIEKVVETACVEESVGEDTEEEEEEDEWNYIKGDKKTDESLPSSSVHGHQNLNEAQLAVYSAQEIEPAGIKTECVELPVPNIATDLQLLDFYVDTNNAEKADSVEQEKENLNDATAVAEATPSHDPESNKLAEDTFADHQEQPAVLIQQELAHTHENISIASSSAITPIPAENVNLSRDHPEETERIPLQEQASAFITEEKDLADILTEPSAKLIADDASSLEVLAEDTVSPDIEVEHEPETVAEKREVEQNEASVIQQPTEEQSSLESETSVDEDLERPNSLSLEMASKLNPEAKEFVPVSSPSRSNPTSPVANPSTMIGNPYLLLDDDAVVAQSPKKCTATMDNIDVPEEDDFQHEMDIRPHELEKPSEFVNGTTEMSARSHSPASEQSYQELNLKEAMQADEKLEHDYNDDKQVVPEDSPLELSGEQEILNVLNKEQDPMNMSFYEGRDEALLSNSDELNKVHVLPEEDDFEEQSNDDGKKLKMCQTAPVEPVRDVDMLEDKVEIKERVTAPQSEENIHVESKSPLQEEPSAAIFAVASQVVNDVAALVDQMHIESVVSNDRLEAEIQQDDKLELDQRLTVTEDNVMEPSQDIMISLEKQNEITPLEDAVVMERHVESSHPNIAGDNINIHTAESDDLVSPMVEAMEHEVVAENEFITDESVLNVIPSPLLCKFSAEAPVEYDQAVKETANETPTQLNNATVPVPTVDTQTTNLLESVTPILDQIVSTPVATVEEPKLAIVASKSTTAKVTATTKSAATTKTMASKTVSKPTTTTANRKLPMVSKASPKAAPPKSSVSARPSTATSPAKKSTTVSHATATTTTSRTVGAAKPSTASSATHVSLAPTTTNKTAVAEKKAPLVAKKTGTSAINADLKAAPTSRKPLATTILKTSTVTKSVSTTSSTSIVPSARLSGTSVKSTSAKPLSTAAKSSTSAPSKPASATSRTVSTAPAAKPRTVPSTVNKTASATSTSTMASKISQGSSSSVTKRVSTVGTATSRTTTATKAPTASTTKTSSVSSRTSTVLKQGSSSTTSTVRKTTTTLPTKKPVTSPSTKTTTKASSTGKIAASSTKVVVSNHINDVKASVTEEFISNDLLDLDKQLKNDNNQLITKNGIDPQMMVIDLAAD